MPQPNQMTQAQWGAKYKQDMKIYAKQHPENVIAAYRYDHKSDTGVESLPTYYKKDDVVNIAQAMKDAKDNLGGRTLNPEDFTNLLLKEGRSNAGFNNLDKNNREAQVLANQLGQIGYNDLSAGAAAAIHQKLQLSDRLNIPFGMAWNGTGKNEQGVTGREYAAQLKQSMPAVTHPANQELYSTVKNILQPSEWDDNTPAPKMKSGGIAMPQEYSTGSWKLI